MREVGRVIELGYDISSKKNNFLIKNKDSTTKQVKLHQTKKTSTSKQCNEKVVYGMKKIFTNCISDE